MKNEFQRRYTASILQEARNYFDHLSAERLAKLYKNRDIVVIPSVSGRNELAFEMTDADYYTKVTLMNSFVAELLQLGEEIVTQNKSGNSKSNNSGAIAFDENTIFACKKEKLSKLVSQSFRVKSNSIP